MWPTRTAGSIRWGWLYVRQDTIVTRTCAQWGSAQATLHAIPDPMQILAVVHHAVVARLRVHGETRRTQMVECLIPIPAKSYSGTVRDLAPANGIWAIELGTSTANCTVGTWTERLQSNNSWTSTEMQATTTPKTHHQIEAMSLKRIGERHDSRSNKQAADQRRL